MRRLRTLMVASLVVAALAVTSVTVWAATAQAARGSKFCDNASRLFDDVDDFDPNDVPDLDDFEVQYDDAIKAYKKLAKQAPKSLRKAYRTSWKYFETLRDGDVDYTDPEAAREFAEQGTKFAKANVKISKYLSKECGIDLSDVDIPGGSVPDISIPDISIPDISIPGLDDDR